MLKPGSRILIATAFILASTCAGGPAGPTATNYAGEWNGTTFQGSPIVFTVSSDQKLTKITVGYSFNGCSGSSSFAPNVALGGNGALVPVFDFESAPPGTLNRVLFHFFFTSGMDAHGMVTFADYAGCGTVTGPWTGSKR